MRVTLAALFTGAAFLGACADLAGITELPEAGDSGTPPPPNDGSVDNFVCPNSSTVIVTTDSLGFLAATNGYAYAENNFGLVRCPVGSTCTVPTNFIKQDFSSAILGGYAVDTNLTYSFDTISGQSQIRTAALDGTNDQVLLGNVGLPQDIAKSGSKVFWVDAGGSASVVHCIGCSGNGDAEWMTNLGFVDALWADANDVYVAADDGSKNGTDGIYGCSVNSPCGSTPRTVVTGVDIYGLGTASDGTNVYLGTDLNVDYQVVKIDPSGNQTVFLNQEADSIAVDTSTQQLFYMSPDGEIGYVPLQGGAPITLTTCNASFGTVSQIAIDSTYVYVLVTLTSGNLGVYAISR